MIEFARNKETGILEVWKNGKKTGEIRTTGDKISGWQDEPIQLEAPDSLENDPKFDGGPGSGNFGHEGVPGQRGGSAPGGGGEESTGKTGEETDTRSTKPFDSASIDVQKDIRGDVPKETIDRWLTACGANVIKPQAGDDVRVKYRNDRATINIETKDAYAKVFVREDKGELYIDELGFKEQGQGKGTAAFEDMVNSARSLGLSRVKLIGGGMGGEDNGGMNGYYSFARMGCDAPLWDSQKEAALDDGIKADTIQDLMSTEKGRNWWKNNGCAMEMTFDTDPESDSSKRFTEYREGRRHKEDEQRADDEWITINGTHVQTDKDGNLKGSIGEKISSTSKSHKSPSGKGGGKNSLSPDEFDKYVSENGSQVLYRGFSAPSEEAVKEYASSIKNGESPVSGENTSALGKGVYFTPKKEEAEGYVTRRQQEKGESHGRVVTAALDKDAKIADQNEINRLTQQKYEEGSEMMRRAFKVMREEGEEAGEKLGEEANALMKMDVASYAATKGYDALQAYDGTIVVMNQKKLLVRDDRKDIMPEEVFFQEDDEGNIWAIRGREVIGEVSEDDLAKGGFQTDEGWITVNGTHILTDKEGNLTGKIGEKISATSKGSKGGSGEKKLSEEMTPKQTGYDIDLEEGYQDFVRKNMGNRRNPKLLYDLYHKAEDEGKDGVEEVKDEYHKTRLAMCTKDLKEISKDEADEILYDNLRPGTVQAWFREYNHEAKDALVAQLTRSPEVHNAALNIMYDNYKYQCQDEGKEPLPYDKFLVTPIKMYRGGTGKEYDTAGTFSSYTFNRGVAEKFTGGDVGQAASYDPNGVVYEAEIRPIDTYGSVFSNGEAEICVPRMIAPNKNRDSAADSADIKETPQDWRTHRRRPRGKTSLWGRLYIIGNEYLQKKLLDMAGRRDNVTIEGNKTQRSDDSPSAWITLENGAHIPLGESGEALGGAGGWAKGKDFSGAKGSGEEKGYSDKPSATGANKPCTGFKNKYLAKRHRKHWDEFGVSSQEEYDKLAIDFIKQPVGGDIDGYMRETGEIVRFNRKTGELGIGRPGKEVVTFFKARYDKKSGKVRLNAAVNYFNRLKELEAA